VAAEGNSSVAACQLTDLKGHNGFVCPNHASATKRTQHAQIRTNPHKSAQSARSTSTGQDSCRASVPGGGSRHGRWAWTLGAGRPRGAPAR
jgi:hypothetical protein